MRDKRHDGIEQLHSGNLKENPYKVPKGYFDEFPRQLQERIHQQRRQSTGARLHFMHLLKPQLALVLGIFIFAIISVTAVNYLIKNQQATQQVAPIEYAKMMEEGIIESSEQHFIDILLEEEQAVKQKKLEEEAYIDYLVDEGIDYGTLMDEF